jgi:hypothetical protein
MPGARDVAGAHGIARGLELEDDLLEPQLIDLMHDDEQELVVGGRIRQQFLEVQQLRDLEIAPVGELPVLFAEARGPAMAQLVAVLLAVVLAVVTRGARIILLAVGR